MLHSGKVFFYPKLHFSKSIVRGENLGKQEAVKYGWKVLGAVGGATFWHSKNAEQYVCRFLAHPNMLLKGFKGRRQFTEPTPPLKIP